MLITYRNVIEMSDEDQLNNVFEYGHVTKCTNETRDVDARASTSTLTSTSLPRLPYNTVTMVIIEQPTSRVRFKRKTESLSGGQIYGVNATPENLTYPTIRLKNYTGSVVIVVSCVTTDNRPHPNKLVGHKGCREDSGVCTIRCNVTPGANEYRFRDLSIQLTERSEVNQALQARASAHIDPFHEGYKHGRINRFALRLAFQVFLGGRTELPPVTSDIIRHHQLEVFGDLVIMRQSLTASPVSGGVEIFMFCNKVPKDTVVEFYETGDDGAVMWSETVSPCFTGRDGLVVQAPPYSPGCYNPMNRDPINVWLRLERKEQKQFSAPVPFEYYPTPGAMTKRKPVVQRLLDYSEMVEAPSSSRYLTEARAWHRQNSGEGLPVTNQSLNSNNSISPTNQSNPTSHLKGMTASGPATLSEWLQSENN